MKKLILASFLSLIAAIGLSGCSDDGIIGGGNDTSGVVSYGNLHVGEFFNESSMSSLDLFSGRVVAQLNNSNWDARLVDDSFGNNFYFRSGDLGDASTPGFQTRFGFGYWSSDLSQSEWDTLSRIPDTDDTLEAKDFTADQTSDFGTFDHPITQNRAFSFYLLGRDISGQNGGIPVFGMVRLDSSYTDANGKHFIVDVKLNTRGKNLFYNDPNIIP